MGYSYTRLWLSFVLLMGLNMVLVSEISAQRGEDPIKLVYRVSQIEDGDDVRYETIAYTFWPAVTLIERSSEDVLIDYGQRLLFMVDKQTDTCSSFKLLSSRDTKRQGQPDAASIQSELIATLATASVEPEGTEERSGKSFTRVKVVWGRRLLLQRRAKATSITLYGEEFFPEQQRYLVSSALDRIDDLFRFAALAEPVYRANPLLRRLDMRGQIGVLAGVPHRIEARRSVTELIEVQRSPAAAPPVSMFLCREDK